MKKSKKEIENLDFVFKSRLNLLENLQDIKVNYKNSLLLDKIMYKLREKIKEIFLTET